MSGSISTFRGDEVLELYEEDLAPLPKVPKDKKVINTMKSLMYNVLSKYKDDEFGQYKMYNHLKNKYNIDIEKLTLVGDLLKELWIDKKITRRISDVSILYKTKTIQKKTKQYTESCKFFDVIDGISLDSNSLIMGAVQSGKTKFIISYSYRSYLDGISTVILVLPTNENEQQIRDRFDCKEYEKHMRGLGLTPIDLPQPIHATSDPNELENLLDGTEPGIVILLCNPSKMKRLTDIIFETDRCHYNLVIDEIDSFYKSKSDRKFHDPFFSLIDNAKSVIGVTATIFDVVLPTRSQFVTNKNMYLLDIPDDYKGFSNLEFVEIGDTTFENDRLSNDWIDEYYDDLSRQSPYKLDDGEIHPIICLHKVERININQTDLQIYFKNRIPNFVSIVYNGKGIYLYNDKLIEYETLMINGVVGKQQDGIFYFNHLSVNTVLGWLRTEENPPSHIMIISGKMADRGISFVSSCYKWHLTHEMMILSETSTAGSLLQSLRICGRYKDSIPLCLITTQKIYDDCSKSNKIQDTIYSKSKELKESYMNECIGEIKFDIEVKMKGRRLAVNPYKKIKIDKTPNDTGEYYVISSGVFGAYTEIFKSVIEYFDDYKGEWVLRSDVIDWLINKKVSGKSNTGYRSMFENVAKRAGKTDDDEKEGLLMMRDKDDNNDVRWWVRLN